MKKLLTVVLLALSPSIVLATPLAIVASPTDTSGALQHNLFHDTTGTNGVSGATLAFFDLDAGANNFWDPDTGEFSLTVNLFATSDTGGTVIGTATASSTNFFGAAISAPGSKTGGLIGTLTWDFDTDAETNTALSDVVMSFMDITYTPTTGSGAQANTMVNNVLTLWGSDGFFNSQSGFFDQSTFGVDMQLQMAEPGILLLMGLGLLGIGAASRRR